MAGFLRYVYGDWGLFMFKKIPRDIFIECFLIVFLTPVGLYKFINQEGNHKLYGLLFLVLAGLMIINLAFKGIMKTRSKDNEEK